MEGCVMLRRSTVDISWVKRWCEEGFEFVYDLR